MLTLSTNLIIADKHEDLQCSINADSRLESCGVNGGASWLRERGSETGRRIPRALANGRGGGVLCKEGQAQSGGHDYAHAVRTAAMRLLGGFPKSAPKNGTSPESPEGTDAEG